MMSVDGMGGEAKNRLGKVNACVWYEVVNGRGENKKLLCACVCVLLILNLLTLIYQRH